MLYYIFRILLYPFIRFIGPLFSKSIKSRLDLELSNINDQLDMDYIFHISSEGELEQSLSLILDYCKDSKVLVVFTSDSVLSKLIKLKDEYSNLYIEAKRVVTYLPFNNRCIFKYTDIKAFFMVRYDFFPELIYYSYKNYSVLLNASLINKAKISFLSKCYLRFCLLSFSKIIYASKDEISRFNKMKVDTSYFCFDLRCLRILERKEKSLDRLTSFKFFKDFSLDSRDKIIIGSFWCDEFKFLEEAFKDALSSDKLLAIAPHKFSDIPNIIQTLNSSNIDSIVISKGCEFILSLDEQKVIIFNIPGILCELYSVFDHAHIGGGWHKSIHSVLEPFLMNDKIMISCGQNISRSTEYEFIKSTSAQRIISYQDKVESFDSLDSNVESLYYNYKEQYIKLKSFVVNE